MPTLSRRQLIVGFVGIAASPAPASAKRKRTPDPSALAYAWAIDIAPRVIPLWLATGPDWIGPIRAAAEMWNGAQPWLRLDVQEIPSLDEGEADTGTILVMAPWIDDSWGGRADTRYDGPQIVAARVRFNDAHYQGRYPWPKHDDRQWIAAHELGHALGLTHAPSGDTGCMALDSRHDPKPTPSTWSLAQLALTYGGSLPDAPKRRKRRRR